jgi:hypothetical protein
VHTGFTFDDGDEFRIVLNAKSTPWTLTDEGHTMMWLSYEDYKFTPARKDIFDRIINSNEVKYEKERISVAFDPSEAGAALNSITHAISQVADLSFLNTDRVANTFVDDMQEAFRSSALGARCAFNENIVTPKGSYRSDIIIDGKVPIVVFGITNVSRCKEAMITMLGLAEAGKEYRFLTILDDELDIPKNERDRLTNRADRSIVGLNDMILNTERFVQMANAGSNTI